MIVDLGDVKLNPDHVVSITRSFHETYLVVKDINNDIHEISRSPGETLCETEMRVVRLLNAK